MSDSYNSVTVDNTAGGTVIIANLTNRKTILIRNNGSVPVYLGFDDSLTTSNGFPLNPQGTIELNYRITKRGSGLYGITASSSTDIRYLVVEQ